MDGDFKSSMASGKGGNKTSCGGRCRLCSKFEVDTDGVLSICTLFDDESRLIWLLNLIWFVDVFGVRLFRLATLETRIGVSARCWCTSSLCSGTGTGTGTCSISISDSGKCVLTICCGMLVIIGSVDCCKRWLFTPSLFDVCLLRSSFSSRTIPSPPKSLIKLEVEEW